MNAAVEKTGTGGILYDRALIERISDLAFDAHSWHAASAVSGALRSAGRGSTYFVFDGRSEFVLRHYRRGGLAAHLNRDRYLWLGAERTRSFTEWRLLSRLGELELPVPRPAAARYCRRGGVFYTADLLTVRVPGIRSLADRLLQDDPGGEFWHAIGAGIRRFHRHGVYHADLNAYNVQVDDRDRLFLLDFDRGRLIPAGPWHERNLARLCRSLRKIKRLEPRIAFSDARWQELLRGYLSADKSS